MKTAAGCVSANKLGPSTTMGKTLGRNLGASKNNTYVQETTRTRKGSSPSGLRRGRQAGHEVLSFQSRGKQRKSDCHQRRGRLRFDISEIENAPRHGQGDEASGVRLESFCSNTNKYQTKDGIPASASGTPQEKPFR